MKSEQKFSPKKEEPGIWDDATGTLRMSRPEVWNKFVEKFNLKPVPEGTDELDIDEETGLVFSWVDGKRHDLGTVDLESDEYTQFHKEVGGN